MIPQHSLPGGRYPFPKPDFHRLDRASFAWRTQTVSRIFQQHALPRGTMTWKGQRVDLSAIRHTALLTVEGELDDISAPGQTRAAHRLCRNIPAEKRADHLQKGVGHYGIFNGRRWREQILPRVRDFILTHDTSGRFTSSAAEAAE